jgi:hypothetical protein
MKIKTREFNGHGSLRYVYLNAVEVTSENGGFDPVTINHLINVANGTLKYKLIIAGDTILNLSLDLNLIKQSNILNTDQTLIGITDKVIDFCLNKDTTSDAYVIGNEYQITTHELINMFNTTYISKDYVDSALYNGNKCPFKIFVPSKNSNFTDYTLVMYGDNTTETNISHVYSSDTLTLDVSELVKFKNIVSNINITASKTSLNEDDSVTLTVTTADSSITEVYAEAVFGVISKTRIPLTNGVGTVNVSSLGLSSGDPVRVKFGYKNYTGVAEYTNIVA